MELESRIEATVAKALENQLLAIVAQLGKESTEQKAAGTRASGVVSNATLMCNHSPDNKPSGTHL